MHGIHEMFFFLPAGYPLPALPLGWPPGGDCGSRSSLQGAGSGCPWRIAFRLHPRLSTDILQQYVWQVKV